MRFLPRVIGAGVVVLSMLGTRGGWSRAQEAPTESAPAFPLDILASFFELGLPRVKGAKWVQASVMSGDRGDYPRRGLLQRDQSYQGTAWLVKEEGNRLELVFPNGERVIARKQDAELASPEPPGQKLPSAYIQPADLEADLKILTSTFSGKRKGGEESEDEEAGEDLLEMRMMGSGKDSLGPTLLFMAQLRENGKADQVTAMLSGLFKLAPPQIVLDGAISCLADARLAAATRDWCRLRDDAAYLRAIDETIAQFSRGWSGRGAAMLLRKKVKESAATRMPKGQGGILGRFRPEHLQAFSEKGNWLLGGEAPDGMAPDEVVSAIMELQGEAGIDLSADVELAAELQLAAELERTADVLPPEDEGAGQAPGTPGSAKRGETDPLSAFLKQKRKAAATLVTMLDDRTLLPIERSQVLGHTSHNDYNDEEESAEEKLKEAYDALPRPIEAGELSEFLLQPILPRGVQQKVNMAGVEGRAAVISQWLERISGLNDEALAWEYLRDSTASYEPAFRASLKSLVETGGEKTQRELREVFLDPAVWSGGTHTVLPLLTGYMKKFPPGKEREEFAAKLLKAVAVSKKRQSEDHDSQPADPERQKRMEAQQTAELKRIEQALNPRDLSVLLTEYAAADESAHNGLFAMLRTEMQVASRAAAEPLILRAAAAVKEPKARQTLLTLLRVSAPRRGVPKVEVGPLPTDRETQKAIADLLEDETVVPSPYAYAGQGGQSVAEATASAVVQPRVSPGISAALGSVRATHPGAAREWLKSAARALSTGAPLPEVPSAERIGPDELKALIGGLSVLPAPELLKQLRTKSADEQLAVARWLEKTEEWPSAFEAAHLVIDRVQIPDELKDSLEREKVQGQRLTQELRRYLQERVETLARAGKRIGISVQSESAANGLTLTAQNSQQDYPAELLTSFKIPGTEGKPVPAALVSCTVMGGAAGKAGAYPVGYPIPVTADVKADEAWQKQHVPPPEASDADLRDPESREYSFDPKPFESRLSKILTVKPEVRRGFTLILQANGLKAGGDASAADLDF